MAVHKQGGRRKQTKASSERKRRRCNRQWDRTKANKIKRISRELENQNHSRIHREYLEQRLTYWRTQSPQ